MDPCRVVVAEDHPIYLKGLVSLLAKEPGLQVVGEATSRHAALQALETLKPRMMLVDLSLGEDNGLDLIKDVLFRSPETSVLVLSMHDERVYAERAFAVGALGYCMKGAPVEHLLDAIRTVAAGRPWQGRSEAGRLDGLTDEAAQRVKKLSDREFEVFCLIGKGLGTTEISAKIHISTKTVDTYKENIKTKLSCATAQAVRLAAVEWQSSEFRL